MKKVPIIILLFLLMDVALPAASYNTMAIVSVSVTDMKSAAGYRSETVSQALMGTPVEVVDSTGYWYRIITPEGYEGWTTRLNIVQLSPERFSRWRSAPRYLVTDYFAVITNQPSDVSNPIADCVMGCILEAVPEYECIQGHVRVRLPDGQEGYVQETAVVPLEDWLQEVQNPAGEDIVATAHKFLGFPYLWGGLSPKGLDCSGLVRMCYFMHGLILLRDARQQIKTGHYIEKEDVPSALQPADLVFFGRESVSHVGIYIGDGMMIHSSLKVRINSLEPGRPDSYTGKQVLGAVRIIGYEDKDEHIMRVKDHPWYF